MAISAAGPFVLGEQYVAPFEYGFYKWLMQGPSDRSFGLTVGGALVAAAVWRAPVVAIPGVALILLGLAWPSILRTPNRLWMRFSHQLSRVTNPVITALVFFCVLTPIGLAMRLFGWDPLRLRLDPAAASYWIPRETPPTNLKNQF